MRSVINRLIHTMLAFVGAWLIVMAPEMAMWMVVIFVMFMVEYEQKFQVWYYDLSWYNYLRYQSGYDLLAGFFGLALAYLTLRGMR